MNIPRKSLFGKLNLSLFRAVESATTYAKLRGNPYVELVHWMHQLWQQPSSDIRLICKHFQISPETVENEMKSALAVLPSGASAISDFSHHIELAIEQSWLIASLQFKDTRIRGAWLLFGLLDHVELRRTLLSICPALKPITTAALLDAYPSIFLGSAEDGDVAHDGSGLPSAQPGEASQAMGDSTQQGSALAKYCSDLTAKARAGDIDPVVGRAHEIRTMVDILLRRRQNNPLLTGEAGVGKTAVVEGLALAIVEGQVPPALQKVKLLSLDVGALLAGASMRGEFESRLKNVLEEATTSADPIILFVDEVHTLVGAGGQAGTGDAANLLKPALARGRLRTIGATTWSEYKKHIEKDPALTRRFQVLQVQEPEVLSAIDMVRGLVAMFTKHHNVTVLDEAVRAAVTLSHRYIPARQLPDKAISLLDTACARVAMSLHANPPQIDFLQQKQLALNVELDLLKHEVSMGHDNATTQDKIKQLTGEQSVNEQSLLDTTQRWQDAMALTAQIADIRSQLSTHNASQAVASSSTDSVSSSTQAKQLEQLARLEAELQALQGETPLVYGQVDEAVVAAIVADWTGIPVGRMVQDDVAAVLGLQALLQQRVVGQNNALAAIAQRVRTARAKMTDPNKPIGTFMLVGPSGVGKTETALALASALYGGEHNLITINMSEYQEAHTVSSLKGSPPGYVGYGEGGVLTEAVRRRPYSVILLDEVEKAHPDVHEVFFQVFDKGWMEDGEGRVIDFKNTLILLTSNTGSDLISQLCDDEQLIPTTDAIAQALQPELRKVFPAAFLGRLSVVPYLPLSSAVLSDIVQLQLSRVAQRLMEQHNITLAFDETVVHHIVEQCGTHESGARRLGQFIELKVLPKLADAWLNSVGKLTHSSPAQDAMIGNRTIHKITLQSEADELTLKIS
jgi:type VI secretion system protein VasG